MSDYTNTFGGAAKDSGDSTLLGVDHDTELDNIATAITTKMDKPIGPTNANLAEQDVNGNLQDAGLGIGYLENVTEDVQARIDSGGDDPISVATTHTQGGNLQLDLSTYGGWNLESQITQATWETIGPTGSGADWEWVALNNVPASARILIFQLQAATKYDTVIEDVSYSVYATHGADATPAADDSTLVYWKGRTTYNDANNTDDHLGLIYVPCHTDQTFKIYWDEVTTTSDPFTTRFQYQGFFND